MRRCESTARFLRRRRTGRSSATRHAAELSPPSCAVVLPSQGTSATATRLSRIGRYVRVRKSDFLRAARAKPAWLPLRYARRVPDGDRRPLHGTVWQPDEVNSIRPIRGRDMMTTKNAYPRWRRRLRRVVGCEGAQCVVPDCPSHRILTRQLRRHRDSLALACRADLCIMPGSPATWSAVRAAAVSARGAQQLRRSGSLDAELGEAAYVHAVAGTCRKRHGCMFAATGRPQGLEAHALTLDASGAAMGVSSPRGEAGGDGTERDDTERGDARPSRCWPSAVPASASIWMGTLPGCACRVPVASRAARGGARWASEEGGGRRA